MGFVSLMKSGKYHKIGRSNSAGRREYELGIQLPELCSQPTLAAAVQALLKEREQARVTNSRKLTPF